MEKRIMTVRGYIPVSRIGTTLPHEHIMVDYIGAEKAGPGRYSRKDVVRDILPGLKEMKAGGLDTVVDCTSMYMGRDTRLLLELSEAASLNIITNTGLYKPPFLPRETLDSDYIRIAAAWIDEWENGIEGGRVRPGFIKTAVNTGPMGSLESRMIRAGARAMRETGLPMMTHTGSAVRAADIIRIIEKEGADPSRWIFAHAQNEKSFDRLFDIARTGVWISLDGIDSASMERHRELLLHLLNLGMGDRVLLSHDSFFYQAGKGSAVNSRPCTFLFDSFLPLLARENIPADVITQLVCHNPGLAFGLD